MLISSLKSSTRSSLLAAKIQKGSDGVSPVAFFTMVTYRLPPRLAIIAGLIPCNARLVDVGTDHGLLPIRLLQENRIQSAIATDIRPGPLDRGKSNAILHGVENISFRLCNGLDGVDAHEADTVVIAGMGGENIVDILQRAPWCSENVRLILQPMSRPEVLRYALKELRLRILSETLVEDSGRLYSVIVAEGGEAEVYSPAELYTGLFRHVQSQALFGRLLDEQNARLTPAVNGLMRSGKAEDIPRLEELKAALSGIQSAERG